MWLQKGPFPLGSVTAVILWFAACSATAQYIGGGPGGRQIEFRPFRVSFSTSSGYDSQAGVFTKGEQAQSSIYAGFSASAAMNYVFSDSFLGSRMSTGYTYYFNRTDQTPYETAINIDSTFRHTFGPQWSMSIQHQIVLDSDQQIGTSSALPDANQQLFRQGEYIINNLSINNSFLLSPRLSFNVNVNYGFTRYEKAASANNFDRDEYGISVGPSYQLSPATTVGMSAGYSRSEHPHKAKIFQTIPGNQSVLVDKVNRSSEQESVSFNVSHAFSSRFSMSGSVGLTFSQFRDGDVRGESVNPVFSFSTGYQLDPRTSISLSYFHSISESEIPTFTAQITDTASMGLTHQFNPKISLSIQGSYSSNRSDQEFFAARNAANSVQSGQSEALSGSISTGYSFLPNLSLDVGYSYTKVLSDFGGSFDRDRIIFNVRFSF